MTPLPEGTSADDFAFLHKATMTRAALLRRTLVGAIGLSAAAPLLSACGDDDGDSDSGAASVDPSKASGSLALLVWQGYDDKNAAKPLSEKGVKISAQYVANNDEFITKLRGGGEGKFDIVTPYHGYLEALYAADLIQPLDYSKLPSTKSYLPEFAKAEFNRFDGEIYSAPLVWGDTPMVYRTDLVEKPPESWLDLRKPEWKDRVVMWDDGFGHILLFSKVLFGSEAPNEINREQLDEVIATLGEIKKNAVTVAPSHGDVADILTRGDGEIATESWAFVAAQVNSKGKPAKTHLPKEGAFAWADSYAIPKGAPNLDAAYAFINTMVSPRGDSIVGGATSSGVTSEGAIERLPADQQKLYPYDDLAGYFDRLGFYGIPPLEPEGDITTLKDWNAAWEEFKAA